VALQKAIGKACTASSECMNGSCDQSTKKCIALKKLDDGAVCKVSGDCSSGMCSGMTKKCLVVNRDNGAPCSSSAGCTSGMCKEPIGQCSNPEGCKKCFAVAVTKAIVVTGSLALSMSDNDAKKLVEAFKGPGAQKVKDALAESIASSLEGISKDMVEINGVSQGRRLVEKRTLAAEHKRRLASNQTKVDYSIKVPAGTSQMSINSKVVAIDTDAFVKKATKTLKAAGVQTLANITITSMEKPKAPVLKPSSQGTAAPVASTSMASAGSLLSLLFSIAMLCPRL